MKEVRVYFEGDESLREGFKKFLKGIEKPGTVKLRVIGGGSTTETRKMFEMAGSTHPQSIIVLLIDSEGELTPGHAKDHRRFYMVQCMESWFLADRDALEEFYGSQCFRKNRLPGSEGNVERISKADVLKGIARRLPRLPKRRAS